MNTYSGAAMPVGGKRKREADPAARHSQPRRRIQVLATNDCHSQMEPASDGLGGIARRATYLREARARHADGATLLLDIGDVFLGSLYFTFFHGEVELATMAHLDYRAMAMGNHDFDGGGLGNFREKLLTHAPHLDILCANVRKEADGGKVDVFHDYKVYAVGGVRVAVVGLLGDDAWRVTAGSLREGLVWEEPLRCARRLVRELRAADVADVYICASHAGVHRGDSEIAVAGLFDAVLSGHEHASIEDHEWSLVPNDLENGLGGTLLQPGWYGGRHVARLELDVGPGGSARGALTRVASASDVIDARYAEDAEMLSMLAPYKASFERKVEEVVGSSGSSSLVKDGMGLPERHLCEAAAAAAAAAAAQPSCAQAEAERGSSCPLGALVAEAFRTYTAIEPTETETAAADKIQRHDDARTAARGEGRGRADFGMVNAGAIRASLPAAGQPVRWRDIDTVWPWPDDGLPVAFALSGAAVRKLLDASNLARFARGEGGMCYQFSGLRYTLRNKAAAQRESDKDDEGCYCLSEVFIGDQPLDESARYTGVTSPYCLSEDILSSLQIPGVQRLPTAAAAAAQDGVAGSAGESESGRWEPASLKDYLMRYVAEHSPLQPPRQR